MDSVVIRLEPITRNGDSQTIAARIDGLASQPCRLWYSVPGDHVVDQVSMAHAFVVSVINQAMAVHRDIVIDAPMSRGLLMNLDEYQRVWCAWRPETFHQIRLHPGAIVDDEPLRADRGGIMSFSGGLDSVFSAKVLAEDNQLAAMVAIRGLDVRLGDTHQWDGVLAGIRALAGSLDRPLLTASTNWNEVFQDLPGYLGYLAPILAIPILLSAHYGYAIVGSAYSYDRLMMPHETNPVSDPLLGRPGFVIRHHGAWARRIHKVAAIASWPEALEHLRPCYRTSADGTACGKCGKCIQTALTFCGLGLPVPPALGGRVPSLEDIARLPMTRYLKDELQDVVTAALQRGAQDEWVVAAARKVAEDAIDSPLQVELAELRQRLDYVLGNNARSGLRRFIRRVTRALRGRSGPRSLPPWRPANGKKSPAEAELLRQTAG